MPHPIPSPRSRQGPPTHPPAPQQPPPSPAPDSLADNPPAPDPCGTTGHDTAARPIAPPRLQQHARGRRCLRMDEPPVSPVTPQQRLLLLDTWRRSGLPAGDFAPLVGISKHTLYAWHRKFQQDGPAGLEDKPRGAPAGNRLPRGHAPRHPHDETGPPRLGRRADQRPVAARPCSGVHGFFTAGSLISLCKRCISAFICSRRSVSSAA
jgi:Homeodomain-like domain